MNTAGSLFARSPAQGADTAIWLAASPDLAGKTGGDYLDRTPQPQRFTADPDTVHTLWSLCDGYLQGTVRRSA
jgi:hypothetical protein